MAAVPSPLLRPLFRPFLQSPCYTSASTVRLRHCSTSTTRGDGVSKAKDEGGTMKGPVAAAAAVGLPPLPGTKPMTFWEQASWVVLTGGIGLIVGLKVYTGEWTLGRKREKTEEELAAEAALEERRRDALRLMMTGHRFGEDGEDPFEGMEPSEIQRFMAEEAANQGIANASQDPFENMSPEEIDAYVAKEGKRGG